MFWDFVVKYGLSNILGILYIMLNFVMDNDFVCLWSCELCPKLYNFL